MNPEAVIQLRVAEAYHKDAGKGVARISAASMASLSLENGGVVAITGKDKIYAIAWPATRRTPATISASTGTLAQIWVWESTARSQSQGPRQGREERSLSPPTAR